MFLLNLSFLWQLEDEIRVLKQKLRRERHDRNLACAAKQPGIAVVGTRPEVKKSTKPNVV